MPLPSGLRDTVKNRWILEHFRCPQCAHGASSVNASGTLVCPQCKTQYPLVEDTLVFLTADLRSKFQIVPSGKVSEHPYDKIVGDILEDVKKKGGMALDCGSGRRPVNEQHLVQVEITAFPNVDVVAVNQALPFADACFDAVISLDVLEHVNDPFLSAREIARVLKPGGVLYVDIPFLQHEHGYPHHYFNMTRMGVARLFEGLLEIEKHWVPSSGHPVYVLFNLINCYHQFLPKAVREEFRKLTMEDFLSRSPKDWYSHPIFTQLPDDKKFIIASTTRALARKPMAT